MTNGRSVCLVVLLLLAVRVLNGSEQGTENQIPKVENKTGEFEWRADLVSFLKTPNTSIPGKQNQDTTVPNVITKPKPQPNPGPPVSKPPDPSTTAKLPNLQPPSTTKKLINKTNTKTKTAENTTITTINSEIIVKNNASTLSTSLITANMSATSSISTSPPASASTGFRESSTESVIGGGSATSSALPTKPNKTKKISVSSLVEKSTHPTNIVDHAKTTSNPADKLKDDDEKGFLETTTFKIVILVVAGVILLAVVIVSCCLLVKKFGKVPSKDSHLKNDHQKSRSHVSANQTSLTDNKPIIFTEKRLVRRSDVRSKLEDHSNQKGGAHISSNQTAMSANKPNLFTEKRLVRRSDVKSNLGENFKENRGSKGRTKSQVETSSTVHSNKVPQNPKHLAGKILIKRSDLKSGFGDKPKEGPEGKILIKSSGGTVYVGKTKHH